MASRSSLPLTPGDAGAVPASWRHEMDTPERAKGPLHLLFVFYLAMAGLALYGQSDGLMAWLNIDRIPALLIGFAIELLAAVLLGFADWRRTDRGEQAIAARLLSIAVALGVAGLNFFGHDASVGQRLLFTGASLAGYAVWTLHSNARRRDALRAAGRLAGQPPVFGLGAWLREPKVVWRARQVATADTTLSVHDALAQARTDMAAEERHRAIAAALRRKLAKSLDSTSADIAMVSYDLDEVAARLAKSVDYGRLTGLLAADIHPDRIAEGRTAKRSTPIATPDAVRVDDADKPQPKPTNARKSDSGRKADAATRVRAALADNPGATQAEIARAARTSDRTVRRVLSAARPDIDAIAAAV
ncbi:hypothetical protein Cco03nite_11350 [Catellatospora coxensis]|uniref:Uncharacterized protein n=2 Tax=Catellatospora coxensis TaxID=310354 RepID=A0A8J3KYJ5_9ACTN|nr:hypothetical protein Cco03nite_11350 [Catellatospora coxensis]